MFCLPFLILEFHDKFHQLLDENRSFVLRQMVWSHLPSTVCHITQAAYGGGASVGRSLPGLALRQRCLRLVEPRAMIRGRAMTPSEAPHAVGLAVRSSGGTTTVNGASGILGNAWDAASCPGLSEKAGGGHNMLWLLPDMYGRDTRTRSHLYRLQMGNARAARKEGIKQTKSVMTLD